MWHKEDEFENHFQIRFKKNGKQNQKERKSAFLTSWKNNNPYRNKHFNRKASLPLFALFHHTAGTIVIVILLQQRLSALLSHSSTINRFEPKLRKMALWICLILFQADRGGEGDIKLLVFVYVRININMKSKLTSMHASPAWGGLIWHLIPLPWCPVIDNYWLWRLLLMINMSNFVSNSIYLVDVTWWCVIPLKLSSTYSYKCSKIIIIEGIGREPAWKIWQKLNVYKNKILILIGWNQDPVNCKISSIRNKIYGVDLSG